MGWGWLGAALCGLWLLTVPSALAKQCDGVTSFHRTIKKNVEAGHYMMAEDAEITARFPKKALVAEVGIDAANRKAPFGSGIAIWLCDKAGNRAIRVVFNDDPDDSHLMFGVQRFRARGDDAFADVDRMVPSRALSFGKRKTTRVKVARDFWGRFVVSVDGQSFVVTPGFQVVQVQVQIFCARGWLRFLDEDEKTS